MTKGNRSYALGWANLPPGRLRHDYGREGLVPIPRVNHEYDEQAVAHSAGGGRGVDVGRARPRHARRQPGRAGHAPGSQGCGVFDQHAIRFAGDHYAEPGEQPWRVGALELGTRGKRFA